MKKLYILSLFALCAFVFTAQGQNVVVKGKFEDFKPGKMLKAVELDYKRFNHQKLEVSSIKEDGTFEMKMAFKKPALYRVSYGRKGILLAIDQPGTISVTLDKDGKQIVTGSQATQDWIDYNAKQKELNTQFLDEVIKKFRASYDQKNKERKGVKDAAKLKAINQKYKLQEDALGKEYNAQSKKMNAALNAYIKKNMASSLVVYAASTRWTNNDLECVKSIVKKFKKAHPDWEVTNYFEERVKLMESTRIGAVAPEINFKNPKGEYVKLSSLRGKYVLVDFWASWCGPCRVENPNIVANYQKYKDKGFTIYGVSFDSKKARWEKAIKKDRLTWPHVSDLKGWSSEAGYIYNIRSIPANLLLDKEGKIIAKNLKGEALSKKLEELMGSSK